MISLMECGIGVWMMEFVSVLVHVTKMILKFLKNIGIYNGNIVDRQNMERIIKHNGWTLIS